MSADNSQRSNFLGYDIFKLIVALILLIILILLLLRGCSGAGGVADVTQAATATGAETSQPTRTATSETITTSPEIISPKDGDQITTSQVTIDGTGQPVSEVLLIEIYDDSGAVIDTVKVGSDGRWSTHLDANEGQHIYVAAAAPAGKQIRSVDMSTLDSLLTSKTIVITVSPAAPTSTPASTQTAGPTNTPPAATPAVASGGAGCSGLISGYLLDKDHYVVGSCDTLSGIAVWLKVTVDDLLALNPQITDPDRIVPGDVVNVPPRPEQGAP